MAELKPSLALEMARSQEKDVKPRRKEEKRKCQALEDIMEEEKRRKREQEEQDPLTQNSWLREGIVVKVVTRGLGDKYYKKKGNIVEVTFYPAHCTLHTAHCTLHTAHCTLLHTVAHCCTLLHTVALFYSSTLLLFYSSTLLLFYSSALLLFCSSTCKL